MTRTHQNGLGLALSLAVLLFHGYFASSMGITDDDRFYVPAARSYAGFLTAPSLERKDMDRAFKPNHEHPPFAKYVMGLASLLGHDVLGITDPDTGCRIGTVLFAALCTFFVFAFAAKEFGTWAGLFAALSLNLMPRFAFHARVPTLDAAVASMYFLAAYSVWKARDSRKWALFSGVAFGLACATKLNAPFMLVPVFVYWLLTKRSEIKLSQSKSHVVLPRFTLAGPSLLVLGPLVFLASWPWLWHDTFARLGEYVKFHVHHYGIFFLYLGEIYHERFAPWHAPFLMLAGTTPLVQLAAAVAGTWDARLSFAADSDPKQRRRGEAVLYTSLHLLSCIGVVAFLNVPKYGGIKLFLPAVPFLALLAGAGFSRALAVLRRSVLLVLGEPGSKIVAAAVSPAIVVLGLLPAVLDNARIHPYLLSYYGPVLAGPRGALESGMERQYYDVFYKDLAEWMTQNLPQRAGVAFVPNTGEYVNSARFLKQAGVLRKDISITTPARASYVVLTHERRWRNYPDLFMKYRNFPAIHEVRILGVPLLSVYRVK